MTGMRRAFDRLTGALVLAPVLAGPAAPAFAQRLGQAAGTDVPLWRVAAALLICLVLAVVGALALRARLRGGGPVFAGAKWRLPFQAPAGLFSAGPRRLQLVETLRLSHQVDICLFRCDERDFLVAATPQGATVLTRGGQAQQPAEAP